MFKSVVNAGESPPSEYETASRSMRGEHYLPRAIFVRAAGAEFVVGNAPYSGKIRRLYIQSSPYFTTDSSGKADSGK
jgi:hypothetical protein